MPNDLYDTRDTLVDKLNDFIPVSVSFEPSGGNALAIAEGSMTIKYKPATGAEITLVQSRQYAHVNAMDSAGKPVDGDVDLAATAGYNEFQGLANSAIGYPPTATPTINVPYNNMEPSKGKLLALVDAFGHSNGKGLYPEMIAELDKLAKTFVDEFNKIHNPGHGLATGTTPGATGKDFFTGTTARDLKVVLTDPKYIAASNAAGEVGNNKNIMKLSELFSFTQTALEGGTFQTFYKSLTGDLGVKGQEAIRMEYTSGNLRLQVENSRASFHSVSLDEEMTNMITFQQAYNANARMITVIDETLDKIINGMGRVGL